MRKKNKENCVKKLPAACLLNVVTMADPVTMEASIKIIDGWIGEAGKDLPPPPELSDAMKVIEIHKIKANFK